MHVELPWTTRELVLGGERWSLRCLDDFERAVDVFTEACLAARVDAAAFDARCPMFGALWPAAHALATAMAAEARPGERVLELGCGLAVPSLVAARRGALAVATDQHPDAEALLAHNAAANGVGVRFARLDWDGPAPDGVPEGGFDRVIASDVLYARGMAAPLLRAMARFLAPGGVGLVTDPGRPPVAEVEAAARAAGLALEVDVVGECFAVRLRRR